MGDLVKFKVPEIKKNGLNEGIGEVLNIGDYKRKYKADIEIIINDELDDGITEIIDGLIESGIKMFMKQNNWTVKYDVLKNDTMPYREQMEKIAGGIADSLYDIYYDFDIMIDNHYVLGKIYIHLLSFDVDLFDFLEKKYGFE